MNILKVVFVMLLSALIVGGCGSGGNVPDIPNSLEELDRQAQTNFYNFEYDSRDTGPGQMDGWGYNNPYSGQTELVSIQNGIVGYVRVYEVDSGLTQICDLQVQDDLVDDSVIIESTDLMMYLGITGFASQDADNHTDARLFITVGIIYTNSDIYDIDPIIVVYKGQDDVDEPWVYWHTRDVETEDIGTSSFFHDFDVAPDGEYFIYAYTGSDGYYKAKIYDSDPDHATFSTFWGSATCTKNIVYGSGYAWGNRCQVAMGAYSFNSFDHNFAYSIPGDVKVRVYYQGANNYTWTLRTTLSFAAFDLDIANDDGYDHLFMWNEQVYEVRYYTLSSTGFATYRDSFAFWGNYTSNGGINRLSWLTAGALRISGYDYIVVMLQSGTDSVVEIYANWLR